MKLLKKTFPNIPFFSFMKTLEKELQGSDSVLDIGCGGKSPLSLLTVPYSVGLEGYVPNVKKAKKNKTHKKIIHGDIREIDKLFNQNSFDTVIALDVIEHLTKKDGKILLRNMEKIAKKKIIIFTPNGFVPQQKHADDLEEHLSGWKAHEMRKLGYKVYGMYGPKFLRGNDYGIKLRPKILWGLFSELVNYGYLWYSPTNATAIFCVKNIKK